MSDTPWYERPEIIVSICAGVVISVICVTLIVVRIICIRRRKKYSYGIVEEDEEIDLISKNEPKELSQIMETDMLNARIYLRSTEFSMVKAVPNMGRDYKKYFLIKNPHSNQYIYSTTDGKETIPTVRDENEKYTFLSILKKLDHPYIMKTTAADFNVGDQRVTVIRPFVKKGSLADLLLNKNPLDTFEKKYFNTKPKKYPSNEDLIHYAGCILQALAALRSIGINFKNLRYVRLHALTTSSHNVLMDAVNTSKNSPLVPRLTDIEDVFLGITPHYEVQIKSYSGRVHQDSIAFAELLKEFPPITEIQLLYEKVEREDTSVEELLTMIGATSPTKPIQKVDKKMTELIAKVNMTPSEKKTHKRVASSNRNTMTRQSSTTSIASPRASLPNSSTPTQTTTKAPPTGGAPPPPPPPGPPPPAPAPAKVQAPPQQGRGDLLAEIRKGTRLTFKG